jgi:tRNA(adenine34) deaminase
MREFADQIPRSFRFIPIFAGESRFTFLLSEVPRFPFSSLVPEDTFIDLHSDQYFMGEALRQAHKAWAREEVPVGAIIVHQGKIIARAHNQVETLKDATAHAEMLAITQAESVLDDWRLTECDLYVTKEPCPMCAGAIVHVRLRRVIFGCSSPKDGAAGGVVDLLRHPKLNHQCMVTSGVMENESAEMLRAFFRERRDAQSNE